MLAFNRYLLKQRYFTQPFSSLQLTFEQNPYWKNRNKKIEIKQKKLNRAYFCISFLVVYLICLVLTNY